MNNLRNKVRKAILPKCEGCGGSGNTDKHFLNEDCDIQLCLACPHLEDCKTCNGKGYVEELSFGCELKDEYGTHIYLGKVDPEDKGISILQNYDNRSDWVGCVEDDGGISDYENLGKPVKLREVLLALNKLEDWAIAHMNTDYVDNLCLKIIGKTIGQNIVFLNIPLTLAPEEWDQELQDKICEIL